MEDTQQRLKDTAEACIKAYDTWGSSKKNLAAREQLQEALHELRKVAARLEIEVAVSERDEMTQRPIAVPPHRAQKNRSAEIGNELPDFITDAGNAPEEDDPNDRQPNDNASGGLGRRPQQRSGGQGGPRRQHSGPARRPFSGGGQGGSQE